MRIHLRLYTAFAVNATCAVHDPSNTMKGPDPQQKYSTLFGKQEISTVIQQLQYPFSQGKITLKFHVNVKTFDEISI